MRFVLFVEGHVEHRVVPEFLKRWLDARLEEKVGITSVRFEGWPEYYRDAADKAHTHLEESPKKDKIIAVIGLLDLYGPTFYPPQINTVAERYQWAEQHMREKVNHPRFHQFFAVHETEAWLLSNPSLFPPEIRGALAKKAAHPEKVNFDEPPAKFLEHL